MKRGRQTLRVKSRSLWDVRRLLTAVEVRAINEADIEALSLLIDRLARGYTTTSSHLETDYVYRSRTNPGRTPFNAVGELSHPNADCAKLGRANLSGKPVFYCSSTDNCAIFEQQSSIGDVITVSQWRAKQKNTGPYCFVIGDLTHKDKFNRPLVGKGTMFAVESFRKLTGKQLYKKSLLIDEHFSSWFKSEGEEFYNLTNAIAKFYMSSDKIDGLVYESVAAERGFNLALKPSSLDVFFEPSAAYMCRMVAIDAKSGLPIVKIEAASTSFGRDGSINWIETSVLPTGFKSYLDKLPIGAGYE